MRAGGNRHWGSVPPGENTSSLLWNVVDTPLQGFYSSQNISVIRQHLAWFRELGIDFLIFSWWGSYSYEDNSTKIFFDTAKRGNFSIRIAVVVEAYDWNGMYNYTAMYEYINKTYVSPYPDIYMEVDGSPLVCFYNDSNMTGTQAQRDVIYSTSNFTPRIVGHSSYVDWYFNVPCSTDNATAVRLGRDGMICIEPRYDDQYLGRDKNSTCDSDLTEGLYDKEWNETLTRQDKVNYIAIYSWNEYHERSQIGPNISRWPTNPVILRRDIPLPPPNHPRILHATSVTMPYTSKPDSDNAQGKRARFPKTIVIFSHAQFLVTWFSAC